MEREHLIPQNAVNVESDGSIVIDDPALADLLQEEERKDLQEPIEAIWWPGNPPPIIPPFP